MLYHLNSFANAEIVTGSLQNIILKVVYSPSSVLLQFFALFLCVVCCQTRKTINPHNNLTLVAISFKTGNALHNSTIKFG